MSKQRMEMEVLGKIVRLPPLIYSSKNPKIERDLEGEDRRENQSRKEKQSIYSTNSLSMLLSKSLSSSVEKSEVSSASKSIKFGFSTLSVLLSEL